MRAVTLDRDPPAVLAGERAAARAAGSPRTDAAVHRSRIASVGVAVPRTRLSNRDLLASCPRPDADDLQRLTGIRERGVCDVDEDSYSLAIGAAVDCLARSGCAPDGIEMIVSCSISKARKSDLAYVFDPPMSVTLQRSLGTPDALCFDVANACAGMFTGVAIVDDFIRRGAIRRGLVVSGEFISHIGQTAARNPRGASSTELPSLTLGDSGAAVLLERAEDGAEGIGACELQTFAEYSDLCIAKPVGEEGGWAMNTEALRLHRVAIEASAPTMAKVLDRCGLTPMDIDCVIPHQTTEHAIRFGTHRLIQLVMHGFRGQVVYNLETCGNTASTTHFVALHRCLNEGRLQAGQRVMLLCFASGVVVGTMVFTVDDELVSRYPRSH
jgi:3-oxoacyl-[acyl-carrier-protein] synthase-3